MDRHLRLVDDEPVVKEKSCFDCMNAMFGTSGTFCRIFTEEIWNEKTAAFDCDEFEEDN